MRGNFRAVRPWRAIARPLGLSLSIGVMAVASAGAASVGAASSGSSEYVPGIDISHWQGQPDWAAVRADGVRFAFIKATEARTFIDDQYAANKSDADEAGMPVGAYHYARPDATANDAVREADHFLDTAALKGRNLLPAIDLEDDGGLGIRALKRWVKAWLARVDERLGVKAIIYTFPSFWRDEMGDSRWFADNGYVLWIAHWGAQQPDVPAQNWGGRGWMLWQHDTCGSVAGIEGCVDRDRLVGATVGSLRIKNSR